MAGDSNASDGKATGPLPEDSGDNSAGDLPKGPSPTEATGWRKAWGTDTSEASTPMDASSESLKIQRSAPGSAEKPKKKQTTRIFARKPTSANSTADLEDKIKRLDLLHQVAKDFVGALDLKELMDTIFSEVITTLRAEAGSLWLVEDKGLVCKVAKGPETKDLIGLKLPMGTGIVGWCANKGESAHVKDTSKDTRFSKAGDRRTGFKTRSMISVPMKFHNEVLGVLQVINKVGGDGLFSDDDLNMLEDIATYAAISINNARLYESQRRVEVMNTLMEISSEITSTLDLDTILVTIVNGTQRVVKYERSAIALEENGKAKLAAISGVAKIDTSDADTKILQEALAFLLSRKREEWIPDVDKVLEDDTYPSQLLNYFRKTTVKAFWARIMKDEEGVLGIFMLESNKRDFIGDIQGEILGILTSQTTVAVRNAQLYSKVPFSNVLGGLTGKDGWWRSMSTPKKAGVLTVLIAFILAVFVIPNPFTTVSGDFEVQPSQSIPLYAAIDGLIDKVHVRNGQSVRTGDPIISFKTDNLRSELERLNNDFKQVQQQIGEQSLKANPDPKLQLELESIKADIQSIQADIRNANVYAPFDGIIESLPQTEVDDLIGQKMDEADELCSVIAMDRVEIEVKVDEADIRFINEEENPRVTFFSSSFRGQSFVGVVNRIDPIGVPGENGALFKVKVELENPPQGLEKGMLLRGMTGRAEIDVENTQLFVQFLRWMGLW